MKDADRSLRSLQKITPDGKKKFAKGCKASGMYAVIPGTSPIIIAEGFATACSINEATGYRVAIAFSCGNLMSVAKQLREKYPDKQLIVAADSEPLSWYSVHVEEVNPHDPRRVVRNFRPVVDCVLFER